MKTILIIDDKKDNCRQITEIINKMNEDYTILEAEDSKSASEVLSNHKADLVFIDIMLPGKSGPMLCIVLKEQNTFIPIIAISTQVMTNIKIREKYSQRRS